MRRLLVLTTSSVDPALNIAAETHLFNHAPADTHLLFLWRNSSSVILGRNQNAWKECNLGEMERRGVALVRRHSGGGAVYHDLGNTNFSFVSPKDLYSKDRNCALLLGSLKEDFGIEADLKGRNDIVYDGMKISGHAYKYSTRNALHHGTLLREVSLPTLAAVLNPHKQKLQSKGVTSVEARVRNLASLFPRLTHESFSSSLADRFVRLYTSMDAGLTVEHQHKTPDDWLADADIAREVAQLRQWDWNMGESPQFAINVTHKFPWGLVDVFIDCESRGVISRAKIYSDALFPDLVAAIERGLNAGVRFDANGMSQAKGATLQLLRPLLADAGGTLPTESLAYAEEFFAWMASTLAQH